MISNDLYLIIFIFKYILRIFFSDGIIFVNQTAIPGSNIFEIFPFLYKSSKPKTVPGLVDIVSKIIDMGLQDYIVLSKKSVEAQKLSKSMHLNNTNKWWFLD
jgi:hypothetical protein